MTKNAIVERIERLSDQWHAFVSARDSRILCWQLAHDELSLALAFFQAEAEEESAEHLDLFVPVLARFASSTEHGFALVAALGEEYAHSRAGLHELGLDHAWEPPPAWRQEHNIAYLIRACESLHTHYRMPGKLVLVLRPDGVKGEKAYQQWLQQLAGEAPAWLRVVLLDELDRPGYRKLLEAALPSVVAVRADLDMPGALQQLSNEAGHLDTPGGKFRDLFLRLTGRIGKGDLEGATAIGEVALAHVAEHGLWHLGVPIHFALASGLLAASRFEEAALHFGAAEASALRGEESGPEEARATCKTLRFQSRLGHGSALLGARAYERAAHTFADAAPLAIELGDPRGALDGHRLACFAYERAGQPDAALREGRAGLEIARAMDPATRESSNFEPLCEALLRVTSGVQRRGVRRELEVELAALRSPGAASGPRPAPSQERAGAVADVANRSERV